MSVDQFVAPLSELARCNLLEEVEQQLAWRNGVTLNLTPFQIVTLKLSLHQMSAR